MLALCPWFIVRELLLDVREEVGLGIAMSLGAFTGIVVILRAFILWLLRKDDPYRTSNSINLYLQDSVRRANSQAVAFAFLIISVILEPSIIIIAQAIPMFRVMFAKSKMARSTANAYRVTEGNTSNAHSPQRTWNRKVVSERQTRKEPDEELLHVRVEQTAQLSTTLASAASEDGDDMVYAGGRQATKIW